jgi:hypothetical protein
VYESPWELDRPGGTIQGLLGFGAYAGSGFGLGVEGGYTLPIHLYLGGNFTYFTGNAVESAYLFEFQVGYDLAVIRRVPILIRPYGGLGYERFNYGLVGDCGIKGAVCEDGGGSFLISLGAVGTYFFTPHWFAGVDLRIDIPTAGYGWTVFDFFGVGGYKF